jgi:hypothetical protein
MIEDINYIERKMWFTIYKVYDNIILLVTLSEILVPRR